MLRPCFTFQRQQRAMSRIETKKPSLPTKVLKDIKQSLAQANRAETVCHADAMEQIRVWRKRVG